MIFSTTLSDPLYGYSSAGQVIKTSDDCVELHPVFRMLVEYVLKRKAPKSEGHNGFTVVSINAYSVQLTGSSTAGSAIISTWEKRVRYYTMIVSFPSCFYP